MKGQLISNDFKLQYLVEGDGILTIVVGSSIYYDRSYLLFNQALKQLCESSSVAV